MKIKVKVKAGSKCDCIKYDEEKNLYIVTTKVPPKEGRANEAVLKLLAGYFKVPKSQVSLRVGQKSKIKVFEVE